MRNDAQTSNMAHVFVCSSLILIQNLFSYNYSMFDIALQLFLMKKKLKPFRKTLKPSIKASINTAEGLLSLVVNVCTCMYTHLQFTLRMVLVTTYSVIAPVLTQFGRAWQDFILHWQDDIIDNRVWEPMQPIEETERDPLRDEIVCPSHSILQHHCFSDRDPHVQCPKLALCIARRFEGTPPLFQPAGPLLIGPDSNLPPRQPLCCARITDEQPSHSECGIQLPLCSLGAHPQCETCNPPHGSEQLVPNI